VLFYHLHEKPSLYLQKEIDSFLNDLQTNVTAIHVMKKWTKEHLESLRDQNLPLIRAHAVMEGVQLMCDVISTITAADLDNMKFEDIIERVSDINNDQHRNICI
jgi:tryptophan 2,3-dioxygenase